MNGHDAPEISHANAPSSSGLIEAIDKTTVHKICSGQVVLSLATAVKELVENSIDAGATNIEVRVKEYGSEQIEVIDNGHGVEEANFEGLTLKHHTSKLQDFTDLWTVDTFGFRGEALSSLCALSTLSIITCHRSASVGTHLEYDNRGVLIKRSPCPREVGTTVTVKNIFSTLPVRHKEFLRNLRREYTKMVNALSAYALIHTDVRIVCSNQPSKGKKSIVLSSQLCNSLKESIACIFGTKQLSTLLEFQQSPLSSEMIADYSLSSSVLDEPNPFKIEGWISTCAHGQGRSSADRQFFYVNNRPCDLVKVSKVVNKVYHSFNRHQYPFVLINITVEKGSVDVNVTPDKRKIFVENEKLLLAIIEESLLQLYKNIPSQLDHSMSENAIKSSLFIPSGTSIKKDSLDNIAPDKKSGKRTFTAIMDMASRKSPALPSINKEDSSTKDEDIQCLQIVSPVKECKRTKLTDYFKFRNIDNKSTHLSASSTHRPSTINEHKSKTSPKQSQSSSLERFRFKSGSAIPEASDQNDCAVTVVDDVHCMDVSEEQPTSGDTVDKDFSRSDGVMNGDELEVDGDIVACDNETSIDNAAGEVHCASTPVSALAADCEDEIVVDEPSFRDRESTVLHVSLESLKERIAHKGLSGFAEKEECLHYRKFKAKITPSDNDSAEAELRKQLSKDDFEAMEIIGQFNLGFIIGKKDSDLFIIDQHATDEKYNFEMLQQNTVLETQGLIQPQKLELTAVNESLLLENMDVFLKNGFSFEVDDEAPVGQKVRLVSVPVSHNWTFGKSDIDELIFMLSDSPGVMCRPSRVRQMFASRACRKSVMIGTALSLADMKKLVRHMGTIEQPWNCPHGRPTIRHLFDLNILQE